MFNKKNKIIDDFTNVKNMESFSANNNEDNEDNDDNEDNEDNVLLKLDSVETETETEENNTQSDVLFVTNDKNFEKITNPSSFYEGRNLSKVNIDYTEEFKVNENFTDLFGSDNRLLHPDIDSHTTIEEEQSGNNNCEIMSIIRNSRRNLFL